VAKLRLLLLELLTEAEAKARRSRRAARDYWVGVFSLEERFHKRWGRRMSAMECGFRSLEEALDAECRDVCRLVEVTMGSGPLVGPAAKLETQGEEALKAARREVDALEASRRRSADVQDILRKVGGAAAAPVAVAHACSVGVGCSGRRAAVTCAPPGGCGRLVGATRRSPLLCRPLSA
jgi:hypothetical protein